MKKMAPIKSGVKIQVSFHTLDLSPDEGLGLVAYEAFVRRADQRSGAGLVILWPRRGECSCGLGQARWASRRLRAGAASYGPDDPPGMSPAAQRTVSAAFVKQARLTI